MKKEDVSEMFDKLAKDIEENYKSFSDTRSKIIEKGKNKQNLASLKFWLENCALLNINHVDAKWIGSVLIEDLFNIIDGNPVSDYTKHFFENYKNMVPSKWMVRWDCCAGHNVKWNLGTGKYKYNDSFKELDVDDPRFVDIVFEYPSLEIPVWTRPWIEAEIYENYPVEFRVFANEGKILGCSNYYIQRDLPEMYQGYAEDCIFIAEKFLNEGVPKFSADFMLTKDKKLLFLEGGPPHHEGAHPCCFEIGKIDGIELKNRA